MLISKNPMGVLIPVLVAVLLLGEVRARGAAAFEGTLQVTKDSSGKIEGATLPARVGKNDVELHIVLDKLGQDMAAEAGGRTVQVSGSISVKKNEQWLKVKSYSLLLMGTADVTRDEKRKLKSIVFKAEGWPSPVNVMVDSKAKALVKGAGEQTFLVTGNMVEVKEGEKVLKIKTALALETLTGVVEVKEDKKGRKTGASLVVENEKGKVQYMINLDAKGNELMEGFEDATVEVVGVATGRGAKRGVKVIRFRKV